LTSRPDQQAASLTRQNPSTAADDVEQLQVIVVGAGIAGLTAAYCLAKTGIRVKVLESSSRVGGRMTTDEVNGFLLDRGAQFLSSEYNLLQSLVNDVGLRNSVRESSPWTAMLRNGKMRLVRADNPLYALTSGQLGLPTWLRLAWQSWRLRRPLRSLALNDYSQWASFDTETASSWVNRAIDSAATEYFFEPLLHGFYFQEPEETSRSLSLALFAFGLRRSRVLTLGGGVGTLPEALASRLDVVLNAPVTALASGVESVTVETESAHFQAEYVVLATTAPEAQHLYRSGDALTDRLLATRYSSAITIALMTDDRFRLPARLKDVYGLLVPRLERGRIAGIGIESNKNRNRAPRGQLFNILLSNTASSLMTSMADDAIVEIVAREAEQFFPGLTAHVTTARIYRWKHAEPYSHVGRAIDLRQYRNRPRFAQQRVLLAGDYMSMPFTEGAAESGQWAAQRICDSRA
jgi:oxygen-dependent protoporphyrinogen oxidase